MPYTVCCIIIKMNGIEFKDQFKSNGRFMLFNFKCQKNIQNMDCRTRKRLFHIEKFTILEKNCQLLFILMSIIHLPHRNFSSNRSSRLNHFVLMKKTEKKQQLCGSQLSLFLSLNSVAYVTMVLYH